MDIEYKKYLKDTIRLVKSLVIKSPIAAEKINELVKAKYALTGDIFDPYDKTSWKFYLNLAGVRHKLDPIINITSLDTGEVIEFNKNNLRFHYKTKKAYTINSELYNNLLINYPECKTYIDGVLNNLSINDIVSAADWAILSYDKTLIESQETTLLYDIEKWIKEFYNKWYISAYSVSNSLYPTAFHAILYLYLPSKILNLRNKRSKTLESHSFHLDQYLKSNIDIGRYLGFLTLKQKLWLVRNIKYLIRNSGKQDTLNILIEHLLTERYLPISEYTYLRNQTVLDDNYQKFEFYKNPLNPQINIPVKTRFDLIEILDKESLLALDNQKEIINKYSLIEQKFKNSKNDILPTKVLESIVVDFNDAYPYKFTDLIYNTWGYLISEDRYDTKINITLPINNQKLNLNVKDAFIYINYLLLKYLEYPLNTPIPNYNIGKYLLTPLINRNEFINKINLVDPKYAEQLSFIYDNIYNVETIKSVDDFYIYCQDLFSFYKLQYLIISNIGSSTKRAYIQEIFDSLYACKCFAINNNLTFEQWLISKNLIDYNFSKAQLLKLMDDVLINATGYKLNPYKSVRYILQAMIEIMKKLTSYSIQYVYGVVDTGINISNNLTVRTDNLKVSSSNKNIIGESIDIIDLKGSSTNKTEINNSKVIEQKLNISIKHKINIILNSQIKVKQKTDINKRIFYPNVSIEKTSNSGLNNFNNLSLNLQQQILRNYDTINSISN